MKLDSSIIPALIGVGGTLLGVILGTLLSHFSRRGKVKLFLNSCKVRSYKDDQMGGYIEIKDLHEAPKVLHAEINFDFFNSSMNSKIVRNLLLVVSMKNNTLKRRLNDYTNDEIINVNLRPREIQHFCLEVSFDEKIKDILGSYWYIEYRNDKNKLIKIPIKKSKLSV